MQDKHKELVEGRYIALLHHHPNNSPASLTDLDAEYMIVVNQDGTQHHYERVGGEMMPLAPIHNPAYVAESDPVETLAADLAFWIQTWSELGNPPEMVMRQGEALWWKEDNIIVQYHTNETIEEVAARMIILPPALTSDEQSNEESRNKYLKEITEFTAYLWDINPEYTGSGPMSIPMPGWSIEAGSYSFGRRTLFRSLGRINPKQWWEELTPTEQKIEMALTATASAREGLADLDNIFTFDQVIDWIKDSQKLIEKSARNMGLRTDILSNVLTSETLYDYDAESAAQDATINLGLVYETRNHWNGAGRTNVHYLALIDAYDHMATRRHPGSIHPWNLDPYAPDLLGYPRLTVSDNEVEEFAEDFYKRNRRWPDEGYASLTEGQRETMKFLKRESLYYKLSDDQKRDLALYLVTDAGAINAASMVTRKYVDDYLAEYEVNGIELLTHEDAARIWGRFRSSLELFEVGNNAWLAMPIAEYFVNAVRE